MTKLCLNMIVKDEAARIERCLASVAPWISSWCIIDTGSADDTEGIISRFFRERNIPGWLGRAPFIDFAQTRNHALVEASTTLFSYDTPDYLLLADADMELVVDDPSWCENLTAPAYRMLQRNGNLSYQNVRLLRRDTKARYIGATHEYLSIEGDSPNLSGAWFRDYADGANRAGKFERDARLLRGEIEPTARSWFYLGQSLRDMGDKREAAEAYGIAAKIDQWPEERYYAEFSRSRCLRDYGAPEWALVALSAFGRRPTRAEPLHDLAKYFREAGLNEVSLLFSERGMAIPKPADDLLFIEDPVYDWGFREEFAICAFYSERHRAEGRRICDGLALDRSVPQHVRETAWRNLFFYTRPIAEVAPSFSARRIDFTPPDGYRPCNPSVCRIGNNIALNVRLVNYLIGSDGRYIMPEAEPEIRTRNLLAWLDDDLQQPRDFAEILRPRDLPAPAWGGVLGFEDMRLFERDGQLWCAASTRQTNAEGYGEMFVARIGGDCVLSDWHVARPEGLQRKHEKNWMPLADGSGFVYSCDRTMILNLDGSFRQSSVPPIAADLWGGSTQLIPFDGGYLTLIHERKADPDPMHGQRNYQRRFVWFDKDLAIKHWSQRFTFGDGEGEFACGLCWHPDEERLIISYGVLDREAWLATVAATEVRDLLWPERLSIPTLRGPGPTLTAFGPEQRYQMSPEAETLIRRLVPRNPPTVAERLELLPPHCNPLAHSWALGNTNRPLRSKDEVAVAVMYLQHMGLPLHHDPGYPNPEDNAKNWDNLIAVSHATATTEQSDYVIDAGGTRDSAFLPALSRLGYGNLANWNIEEDPAGSLFGPIAYVREDITRSRAGTGRIAFVACLSVIEHGVDVRAFLREMARIIKIGGHLFVSFDYWQDPIVCGDRVAFGAPVRIFDRRHVEDMIAFGGDVGLFPVGKVDFACGDRVVEWLGLSFTFMNLLFKRA